MNKQKLLSIILGLTLITICFLPILKSGLYSDDLFNFQHITVYAASHHISVFELAIPNIKFWKSIGRFTPVSFIWMEFVFKYFTTVVSYKFLVFVMNILAVIVFLIYLSGLKLKINYGIWLVCFAAVIQFRISYHDAYTSLNGMYQLLAIFIFASLAFYCYYILKGKIWLLIVSVLIFITGILFSEIGLATLLLLPFSAIILKVQIKKIIGPFLLYILIAAIYLGYTFWLRMHVDSHEAYIGLTSNFDFVSMRNLFYRQLYATLPLSNMHDKFSIPIILLHQLQNLKNFISVLAIILFGFLIFRNFRNQNSIESKSINWGYILLSIVLIICPIFFILPSLKYQIEVKWGIGYLPVYLQNFGTATFFSYIIQLCYNSRLQIIQLLSNSIFIVMVFCSCISLLFNNALINSRSFYSAFPAQVLYESVKNGLIKDCENGSSVLIVNDFFWKQPGYYGLIFNDITGKDFNVYDADMIIPIRDSNQCYLLDCQPGKKVVVSIYKINCSDKKVISLVQKSVTDCDIDLIEEEKKVSNY